MIESLSDSQTREVILSDLDSTILVEAAAGTGKTTSIVGRMVNLVATGKCKIDSLAAVTFTRKAAAELRERFHANLRRESMSDERGVAEKERLRLAIDRIEYAFVGTFHSFCSQLLRERPIECGVDPGFRELEEIETGELREQAWESFLHDMFTSQDGRYARMQELGLKTYELNRCYKRFVEFLDVPQWPHKAPRAVDLDDVKSQVSAYVEHMRELSPLFPADRGTDKLMSLYETIVRATDNADLRIDCQFFDLLERFDSSGKTTLKMWHDPDVARSERDRFAGFRETVVSNALNWWYCHRYEFVIELLEQASSIYDHVRRASGGLDYQDLLLRTAEALKHQPKLRAYFQRRFTHLLVDEFQDTDPIQAEILAYLTSDDNDEPNWHQCQPRPGSLFLVGDPKQSIYRFRRADIVTYQQVKKILDGCGGRVLTLSKNFRSTDQVRTWVNPVFGTLLGYDETVYSPAAVDMEQGRIDVAGGKLVGVYSLSIPEDLVKEEAVAFEAQAIARYIHHAIASKKTIARTQREFDRGKPKSVEPGDFLIVAYNKKDLHAYAEALDCYGINNEVTGSNAFQNIHELKLMLTCLQAIDDQNNPIPYVSVLRGELFGFGDADLYEISRNGGRYSYSSPVPTSLPADLRDRYLEVNARFSRYRLWLRNMPFAAAFSRIASDLGLLARCSTYLGGNLVAGGFLKAVEWLRAQSWNFDSATDVMTYLEDIIHASETDACSVMPQSGSSVRIMNLHKAKGLEAPIVFLANTFGAREFKPHFHVDRSQDITCGYLAITKKINRYGATRPIAIPHNWENFQEEEAAFESAEDRRLLYVACTRAACQLVVSKASGKKERFSHWEPLHDHLTKIPELKIPTVESDVPISTTAASDKSLIETKAQITQSWEAVRKPSYAVVTAKSAALKQSIAQPTWRASGDYGHQWGSAIHELLEIRMNQPDADLKPAAQQFAEEFELGSSRIEELLSTVESVIRSDIWSRAVQASKVYTEIPFETASINEPLPTIVRGVIDLCFEESNGWVIVDYKTDDISETDLENATKFYSPQLTTYAEFWQDITNHTVSETGLYFTKLNQYCRAEPS